MAPNRTGLFIIRAWVEQGSDKPLRAHIRLTTDIAGGFERELTLADFGGISAEVESWLQDFMAEEKAP